VSDNVHDGLTQRIERVVPSFLSLRASSMEGTTSMLRRT